MKTIKILVVFIGLLLLCGTKTNNNLFAINEIYDCYHIFSNSNVGVSFNDELILYDVTNNTVITKLPVDHKYYSHDIQASFSGYSYPRYFDDTSVYYILDNWIVQYNYIKRKPPRRLVKLEANYICFDILHKADNVYYYCAIKDNVKTAYIVGNNDNIIRKSNSPMGIYLAGDRLFIKEKYNGMENLHLVESGSDKLIYTTGWIISIKQLTGRFLINYEYDPSIERDCHSNIAIVSPFNMMVSSKMKIPTILDKEYIYLSSRDGILNIIADGENQELGRLYYFEFPTMVPKKVDLGYPLILDIYGERNIPSIMYDNKLDRLYARVDWNGRNRAILVDKFLTFISNTKR